MKKLWAFLAIMLAFTFTMEAAHAKRMGGGKSFGSSYQTAPSRSSNAAPASGQRQQAAPAPGQRKGLFGGMMGGLLGGLLVGGLFAALFAGGAFNGLQFMDILIIAALAFVLFKVIRMLRQGKAANSNPPQPAYAGAYAGAGQSEPSRPSSLFDSLRDGSVATPVSGGSGGRPVPFKLPLGFDTASFLEEAKSHYRILQDAWNNNDLTKIQEYTAPKLYSALQAERAGLAVAPETEVLNVNAELVRANQQFGIAEVSVRFSGRYRDLVEGVNEEFVDIWHLERDYTKTEAPWYITGIQSE